MLLAIVFLCTLGAERLFNEEAAYVFTKSWHKFLRTYYGCEETAMIIAPGICNDGKGKFDFKAWTEARNAAKKLFDLTEKKNGAN